MAQESTGELVVRKGLLFGPIGATANAGYVIFSWFVSDNELPFPDSSLSGNDRATYLMFRELMTLLLPGVIFLGTLIFTFLAGRSLTRRVGSVGAGALTGLVAGGFGGAMGAITSLAVTFVISPAPQQAPILFGLTTMEEQIISVGWTLFGLLLDCGLGAGMGAPGDLAGLSRYRKTHPDQYQWLAYPAAPWQPLPYPCSLSRSAGLPTSRAARGV